MVGVPGKSKGCSTCRRRKKGCDQARPTCGQCQQSGYKCGGYNRDLTFIHHPASKVVEKAVFAPLQSHGPDLRILPYPLELSANDAQWKSLFQDLFMPHGDCICRDLKILKCGKPMNWTEMIHKLSAEESSLEIAFSAVSISRVGRDHEDPRLVKESTRLYGKALKDLQGALYDPERMYTDEVLTACMLLGLYEVYEGSAQKSFGWISHTQGAARLIELRGPQRHASWEAHHVFLGARVPILYAAILQRKSSFLGTEKWLTLPWAGRRRAYPDKIVDIMAKIPALLERVDMLGRIRESVKAPRRQTQLLEECRLVETALLDWRSGMREVAHPLFSKADQSRCPDYPFEYTISFQNHVFLDANILYWTCYMVLCEAHQQLELMHEARPPLDSFDSVSPTREEVLSVDCATNIAQSILYCLRLEMGALGANIISVPMGLAFRFFRRRQETRICAWFVRTVGDMKARGVHSGRFVETFSAESGSRQSSNGATSWEALTRNWQQERHLANEHSIPPARVFTLSAVADELPSSVSTHSWDGSRHSTEASKGSSRSQEQVYDLE